MTSTEIAAASKIMLGTTEAVAMYIGSTKIWPTGNAPLPHDYSLDYFTIESLVNNNTIKIEKKNSPSAISLSYSTDNGITWTSLTISSNLNLTTINSGDKLLIKGTNEKLATAWDNYYRFYGKGNFKVYGNAMSLLWGDNFINNSEFASGTGTNLAGLFYGTTELIDASNLVLPALTCTLGCYNGTFRGCKNLTTAPQLPATQSAEDCYSSMFEGCINLEVAPEINLINMSKNSCARMFCMSRSTTLTTPKMTKSPILRVSTPGGYCYKEMFKGNGNLVEVTCLLSRNSGCDNWLLNVSATGTFKRASGVSWNRNASGVPSGWTIEDYVEPS